MKSSLSVARNYSHFILRARTNSSESIYTGSDVFLSEAVVRTRQSTQDQHTGSSEFNSIIGNTGKKNHHNLHRNFSGAADCDTFF